MLASVLTVRPTAAPLLRGARTAMTSVGQLERAFTYKKPSPPPAPTGAEKAELERESKREEAAHRRTRLPTGGVDHRVAGATRPHLGVKVKPDHGLWHFFRQGLNDAGDEVRSAVDVASTFHEKSCACLSTFVYMYILTVTLNSWAGMAGGGAEEEELQGFAHALVCDCKGAQLARRKNWLVL